jgi:transcription antitermination protein NusB
MTQRTRGREIALQVLYQAEQNAGMAPAEIRRFVERRLLGDRKLVEFAEGLIEGVHAHQARIDEMISGVAENWRLDRMAAIDRNILRLGAFEMLFCPDVPTKVAINEALELAKRYSTAQSSRFVNGILDRLQAVDPSAPKPSPEPTPGGPTTARATESPAPADKPTPLSVKSSRAPAPPEEPTRASAGASEAPAPPTGPAPVPDEASESPGPRDETPPAADAP